jgi:fimbrial chaperone protein
MALRSRLCFSVNMKFFAAGAVVLGLLLQGSAASASGVNILPLRAALSPQVRTASFRLASTGMTASLMQVHLLAWSQVDGADQLTPSDDLLVGPPIFTILPGQMQLVRVGLRSLAGPTHELSYRLMIDEVPTPNVAGITFAFRLSLPIFVTPQQLAGPKVRLSAERPDATHLRLTLSNTGDEHIQIKTLRVAAADGTELYSGAAAWYVLAGQRRSWLFSLERAFSGSLILVRGSTDGRALNESVRIAPASLTVAP